MNLAELVSIVAATTDIPKPVIRHAVKNTFKTILTEVKKGGRVTLVGFGAFYSTHRGARIGRNPKTGETVKIPAGKVPVFKAGKEFRKQVKNDAMIRKPKKKVCKTKK